MNRLCLSLVAIFAVIWSSACGPIIDKPVEAVNNAIAEIDKAMNDINANSTQWQDIINHLPDKLKGKVDDTIQNELTRFVEHSANVVSQTVVCTTDILAKRALIFLDKLKHALLGSPQKTNLTAPTVCQVPSNIELSALPTGHKIIEASGADFDLKDDASQLLQIAFWSDSKQLAVPIDEARIGRNTKYSLAINLDGDEIPKLILDNDINKILFYWNKSNVEQPQILVLKHIPQTDQILKSIGDVSLIPRWTGGDRGTDINDDNPFSTDVKGKLFISPDKTKVLLNLYMHGRETQSDFTEVEGWKSEVQTGVKEIHVFGGSIKIPVFGEGPGILVYEAPPGWIIDSVTPVGETGAHINITKHGNQNLFQGNTGPVVRTFVVNGGEGGGEAGNQTGVVATFNDITIKIREKP